MPHTDAPHTSLQKIKTAREADRILGTKMEPRDADVENEYELRRAGE